MTPVTDGPAPGHVWLVGAGPGDPGLLTLRAVSALRAADIVFHDALPGPAVLRFAEHARLIDVGKRKGHAPMAQPAICAALVEAARSNLRVVRLKGGDPSMFGRSGEELAALDEARIPWEIVPGVTAASAAAAVAGIPLTLRGAASSASFITGHDATGATPEWSAGTVVAYMGLSKLGEIALRLLAEGRDAGTPVVIVARATLPDQRILRSTLGACTLDARRAALPAPALVIIGEAARRRESGTPGTAGVSPANTEHPCATSQSS